MVRPASCIQAIDISAAQGTNINWNDVRDSGISAVMVECGIGNDLPNTCRAIQIAGAQAAGLKVFAYCFAFPLPADGTHQGRDPLSQVAGWVAELAGLGLDQSLPILVDLEWPKQLDWQKWGDNAAFVREWLLSALTALEQWTTITPVVYASPAFLNAIGAASTPEFGRYPLWIADWTDESMPLIPEPWVGWWAWQYTNAGHVTGIPGPIDLSWIRVPSDQADTDPELMPRVDTCI